MNRFRYHAAIRIAWMYLKVDKTDEALNILEKVLEEQGPDLPYVTTGIDHYKELESEPRFLAILEKMGLPLLQGHDILHNETSAIRLNWSLARQG